MTGTMISAGMLADRLRPIVLGASDQDDPTRPGPSCLEGTPMIPLLRGTVTAIYNHLERLAALDGEITQRAREYPDPTDDSEVFSREAGYVAAFYELADMMGIGAQPRSPKDVWETQMKPRIAAALSAARDTGDVK